MRFETAGGEGFQAFKSEAKLSVGPEGGGMGDVVSAKRAVQDTLTSAGCQQSSSPGELGFLSGQEALLHQEMGQFAMIKVKGAAHRQKGIEFDVQRLSVDECY